MRVAGRIRQWLPRVGTGVVADPLPIRHRAALQWHTAVAMATMTMVEAMVTPTTVEA